MARGNDAAAALADLRGEFAGAGGSAEDLISSARAAWSPELRHANKIQPDIDEDGKQVYVDLAKVDKEIGGSGTVLAAAKRGPFVIAVVETESGRTYKEAIAADKVGFDVNKRDKPRGVDAEAPDVDQGHRDALLERMGGVAEAKALAAKAEEAAEEARQKVYESAQKSSGTSSDSGTPESKSSGGK